VRMNPASAKKYMETALKQAAKAAERTYPNPMVGCVIVSGGKVVGKGYHERAGMPHAEITAIRASGKKCEGSSMFVTLEPCDHYGRTPPCTKAIIASGVREVYVAMKDPNPLNSGRGIRKLKRSGIKVSTGVCAKEAAYLNRKYIRFISEKRPYLTLKLAQSLDGKIAASDGTSKWISSDSSRAYVKKMRARFDAVMVGINTVIKDDPFLLDEKKKGYVTARVIVDSKLRIDPGANILKTAGLSPVIIGTTELAPLKKLRKIRKFKKVDVIETKSRKGRVDLVCFLMRLAERGIVNVLVEGGAELAGALFDERLIDEIMIFIAPKILGGQRTSVAGKGVKSIDKALNLDGMKMKRFGEDIFIRGRVSY
jgi:diaminohydroxyphosphoribosylaminopyrimidine deaminase / 5-amino-6-(5-phosphoribosylamino)uracil reductase